MPGWIVPVRFGIIVIGSLPTCKEFHAFKNNSRTDVGLGSKEGGGLYLFILKYKAIGGQGSKGIGLVHSSKPGDILTHTHNRFAIVTDMHRELIYGFIGPEKSASYYSGGSYLSIILLFNVERSRELLFYITCQEYKIGAGR